MCNILCKVLLNFSTLCAISWFNVMFKLSTLCAIFWNELWNFYVINFIYINQLLQFYILLQVCVKLWQTYKHLHYKFNKRKINISILINILQASLISEPNYYISPNPKIRDTLSSTTKVELHQLKNN